MLHIAGQDQYCPPEAQKQIHEKLDSNPLVTIHDYPEQNHAFGRAGGQHYDQKAAELADLRSLEFLVRHLAGEGFANAQKVLSDRWDEHVKYEFATRDTEDTLKTMVADVRPESSVAPRHQERTDSHGAEVIHLHQRDS